MDSIALDDNRVDQCVAERMGQRPIRFYQIYDQRCNENGSERFAMTCGKAAEHAQAQQCFVFHAAGHCKSLLSRVFTRDLSLCRPQLSRRGQWSANVNGCDMSCGPRLATPPRFDRTSH